jgi:hypothetical protein
MTNNIRIKIIQAMRHGLDLRLLRGEVPWSLAGTSGDRRDRNIMVRSALVDRINQALESEGIRAELDLVPSENNRMKLELVVDVRGAREVWKW